MGYYGDPTEGPTPEQEAAAWDYEDLRRYCHKLEGIILEMVEIEDPTIDVADGVSFYHAWRKAAEALLPKPSKPIQPPPTSDNEEPF